MIVLLPVLAILQYRWLGQLSDAERDRLQRSLRAATADFTQQVDLEVARAIVGLQLDAGMVHDEAWDRYAEKYDAWASAADPSVVRDILLVDAPEGRAGDAPLRLRRWDAEARTFVPAAWPAALATVQHRLAASLASFRQHPEPLFAWPTDLLSEDGSTLVLPAAAVAPLPSSGGPPAFVPLFAYTIVRLDLDAFRTQVVPSAVARHFGTPGTSDYHLAIVTREQPPRVLYESVRGDAAALEGHADVDEPFFGMRPDSGFALMRLAVTSLRAREARGGGGGRCGRGGPGGGRGTAAACSSACSSAGARNRPAQSPPRTTARAGASWCGTARARSKPRSRRPGCATWRSVSAFSC